MGIGACSGAVLQTEEPRKNTTNIMDMYRFCRTLSPGATCRVIQAVNKSNDEVAIKIMDKTRYLTEKLYRKEVSVLKRLSTKNPSDSSCDIVPLLKSGEDSSYCYIVTPYLSGGELFDRMTESKITKTAAVQLTFNMLQAIKYCHDRGVIHRDIKPENFMFADKSMDSNLVLIDFGAASIVNDDDIIDDIAGTPYYLAPELAVAALNVYRKNGKRISNNIGCAKQRTGKILKASDIYAIGVIAYVMITGRVPFRGKNTTQIYEAACLKKLVFPKKDVRDGSILNLSDNFKDFIKRTLCKDPSKRISVEEAMHHPWIQTMHIVKEQEDISEYLMPHYFKSTSLPHEPDNIHRFR